MLRLAVVDAARGIGNGMVIPSGPMRAPLKDQLEIVDAIIINAGPLQPGSEPAPPDVLISHFRRLKFTGPILQGGIIPRTDLSVLGKRPVLAFAGIGYPDRFFDTLRLSGINVIEAVAFKDHHFFDAGDAERLLIMADSLGAQLVTTEKDHVRLLSYDDQRAQLAARSIPFQISMTLADDDMAVLDMLLRQAIEPYDPMDD
jgi:tetraacyldisaccharide 4'-kinase